MNHLASRPLALRARSSILAAASILLTVTPTVAESPSEKVATLSGGQAITRAELEARVAQQLKQLDLQRHQVLEGGLESLIETRLMEREAEKRGVTRDALIAQEITQGVAAAVRDEDVSAFYETNKARLGGQSLEQAAPRLRAYLEQQASQKKRADLLRTLKERYSVKVALEPWRVPLEPGQSEVYAHGPREAPVTLTLFSDFQCPGCRSVEPLLEEVRTAYGDRLRLEFRQFPLESIHPQAKKAAEAALCAGDQGRFWEMHDALFADQRRLDRAALAERAQNLELEMADFDSCLDGGAKTRVVERDMELGREAGVGGTPSIYINGRPVALSSANSLTSVIDDELSRLGE